MSIIQANVNKARKYLHFNGVDTLVNCGHGASLANLWDSSPITIEIWFNTNTFSPDWEDGHYQYIFSKTSVVGDLGFEFSVQHWEGYEPYLEFLILQPGTNSWATKTVPVSSTPFWMHSAIFIHNGDNKSLCSVNGVWGSYADSTAINTPNSDANVDFILGNTYYDGGEYLQGDIGWLRISNSDRYGGAAGTSFIPPNRKVTPYWDANTLLLLGMDEGYGNTVHDLSGNGNNGTIVNGLWRF